MALTLPSRPYALIDVEGVGQGEIVEWSETANPIEARFGRTLRIKYRLADSYETKTIEIQNSR